MTDEILGYSRHPASAVWPDLMSDEYEALRSNIDAQGQDHAILATPANVVIDGWHRLRACAELNLQPVVTICRFSEAEIADKIIGAHTGRRHLAPRERARLVIETRAACGGELAGPGRPTAPDPAEEEKDSSESVSAPITRTSVAAEAGVSVGTAGRAIADAKRDRGLVPDDQDEMPPIPPSLRRKNGTKESTPERPLTKAPFAPDPAPAVPAKPLSAPKAAPSPDPEPPPLTELVAEQLQKIGALQDENEALREEIAVRDARMSPEEHKALAAANNDAAFIRTLKSRVNELQAKDAAAWRTIKSLRQTKAKLLKQIESLKAEVATLKGAGT